MTDAAAMSIRPCPRLGGAKGLVLCGRLDVVTVADVRDALARAIDAGQGDLVIDLGEVEVMDATGLGVLVGAHRRAGRAGRTLVLRHVPTRLGRLLVATRLHQILHVEDVAAERSPVQVSTAV